MSDDASLRAFVDKKKDAATVKPLSEVIKHEPIWIGDTAEKQLRPEASRAFLDEILAVCVKHNRSISHEDSHGAFIIQSFDVENLRWLFQAQDETV